METKTYKTTLAFKADGQPGEFEAVFATLNVIDHDGDVTVPGAFGQQQVIIEQWNHNPLAPPVGKGIIDERGDEAVVSGKFFIDTQAGNEHYKVAKELGEMQEWSYTFMIVDSDYGVINGKKIRFLKGLEVVGVGQVAKGAGINTRTTAIKAASNGDEAQKGKSSVDDNLNTKINLAEIGRIMHRLEIDR